MTATTGPARTGPVISETCKSCSWSARTGLICIGKSEEASAFSILPIKQILYVNRSIHGQSIRRPEILHLAKFCIAIRCLKSSPSINILKQIATGLFSLSLCLFASRFPLNFN